MKLVLLGMRDPWKNHDIDLFAANGNAGSVDELERECN